MNQSCQNVLFLLTQLGIQTFTSSTLPISIFFHQGVKFDNFTPEANCTFLSTSKYDLYIGIGILIGQKWQK